MRVNSDIYMHESDQIAMQTLRSIPGFTQLLKAYMKVWNERQFRIMNMSSKVRIGENQLPRYYEKLLSVCDAIGIDVPEMYLELDVAPNAYTYGDTNPFIVITSGLLETLPDELVPTVIAHECGHIACHHTMFTTMGKLILRGMNFGSLASLATMPIKTAFAYWMRCSEFSADRAAVLYDKSADHMIEVCMRLAGCDKDVAIDMNVDAFMEQALEYRELVSNNMWDKTLEFWLYNQNDHPLTAVRAYECREWANSEAFSKILRYMTVGQTLKISGFEDREVPMTESSKFYVGKNCDVVRDMLIDIGFTSIQAVRTGNKVLFAKPGQVINIRINGVETFEKGTWFPENSEIVITYYMPLS